jgi:hypothetical protein
MDFTVTQSDASLEITIETNMMNYSKVESLRDTIKNSAAQTVILNFTNQMAVLPSSLIGTLLKLIHVDGKAIVINTSNEDFIEMLKAFHLDSIITVNKI